MASARKGTTITILLVLVFAACAGGQTEEVEPAALDSAAAIATAEPTTAREPLDKDLMTRGGVVRVLTPVEGDLFVAGGEVSVDTFVLGDIWASGAIVTIGGAAGGDVRAAGYRVTMKGLVRSNAIAFCNSFMQEPGSEVWGDLRFYCERASIEGIVNGQLKGDARSVRIDGTVKGGVTVGADRVEVGPKALIYGDLVYRSENEAAISQDARIIGGVVHNAPQVEPSAELPTGEMLGFLRGMKVIWFIGLIIVGLLLSVFAPRLLRQTDEVLRRSPFVSLLTGFAIFVCVPVALLFLLVVVVGWPLVLLLTTLHMLGIIFSGIFVGFTVGRVLLGKVKRARESVFWPMALGVLILVVASSIPLIGFLLRLATIMFGLGAISISQWEALKESRRKVSSTE